MKIYSSTWLSLVLRFRNVLVRMISYIEARNGGVAKLMYIMDTEFSRVEIVVYSLKY